MFSKAITLIYNDRIDKQEGNLDSKLYEFKLKLIPNSNQLTTKIEENLKKFYEKHKDLKQKKTKHKEKIQPLL